MHAHVLVLLGVDVFHLSKSLVVFDHRCRLLVEVLQAVPELIRRVVRAAHKGLARHLKNEHNQQKDNRYQNQKLLQER